MASLRLSAGTMLVATVLSGAAPARAEPAAPVGWIVTVTGNLQVAPLYPGSDELGVVGYPSVGLRRVGEPKRFSSPDEGLSFALSSSPFFRFGLVGRYRGGRSFDDDRRLVGFADVDWAVEPGAFVETWPTEFLRARAELRRGFIGHEGFVADLALDGVLRAGPYTFSAGPRIALGDDAFTRTYFGVKPVEAAVNGQVRPYRPSGGVTSVGALAALSYEWSEQWSTTVYASYHRLVGNAARSPVVQQFGSKDQFGFGASLSYSFVTRGW